MTVIGVVGVGKARGVSTIACGLASAAAQLAGSSLLVESDVGGGDIGLWRKVDVTNKSMIEATAAVAVADDLERQLIALGEYCSVTEGSPGCSLLALRAAGELDTQVRAFWRDVVPQLDMLAGPLVVDLGRFDKAGVSNEIWQRHVDVGVVVANGDLGSLMRLHHGSKSAPVANRFSTFVVANGSQWSLSAVQQKVSFVDTLLRWEPKAAQMIRLGNWKKARRSGLGLELNELCSQVMAGERVSGS